jgi:two-component system NtrC family sensor kinase
MVIDEATRCKTIVSGLLNFARQGKLALRDVRLNELICETISLVERQPLFEKVEIKLALDAQLPVIEADPAQLKDVLINIVVNAAEAMSDGGTLNITTAPEGSDGVSIAISDTGCGIPDDNLTKIFNPFFTTKQIGHGTGLGLAISYGIVKMHKGQITVSSQVGVGSTFVITLPRRLTPADQWLPTTLG